MYEEITTKYKDLENQLSDQAILSDTKKLKEISQAHSEIKNVIVLIKEFQKIEDNINQNEDIIKNEDIL